VGWFFSHIETKRCLVSGECFLFFPGLDRIHDAHSVSFESVWAPFLDPPLSLPSPPVVVYLDRPRTAGKIGSPALSRLPRFF